MPLYSVVVPVYNSEKALCELHERLAHVFDDVIKQPFELILVDDGSSDHSYEIMEQLRAGDDRVQIIQLAVNHGQQKTVLCGFQYVRGDYVITMDDDLQHPPEEIPKLIAKMAESKDIDVVIGAYESKKHGPIRRFGTALMDYSSKIIYGKSSSLKLTSFRLIKRYVIDNLNSIAVSRPTVGPLLLQTTKRIVNTTVHHDKRAYGRSGYSFGKLVAAFMNNVINNSDLPLKMLGLVGKLSLVVSVALTIYYTLRYFLVGISIQGWTTTVVLILLFGGLILFALGILGRYLMNIMLEAKKMPKYLVRSESVGDAREDSRKPGENDE